MKEETTYQPTAEQWTAYRLQCWRDDNMIERYHQPEPVELDTDAYEAAWEYMWRVLGDNKE